MTMHKALNLRGIIVRLYVLRKEGGRGFASIEDGVGVAKRDWLHQPVAAIITEQ